MSKHTFPVPDKRCVACDAPMETVHIKNPFVDDCADQCSNLACEWHGAGERAINTTARLIAKREAYEARHEREDAE